MLVLATGIDASISDKEVTCLAFTIMSAGQVRHRLPLPGAVTLRSFGSTTAVVVPVGAGGRVCAGRYASQTAGMFVSHRSSDWSSSERLEHANRGTRRNRPEVSPSSRGGQG